MVIAYTERPDEHTDVRRPFTAWRISRLATLLGLFGFAVSFSGSWIPSFWGDEAASVMSAERSLPSLFAMLGNVDAVHGTYYLLLHFWVEIFGASPLSVRLPSAIAVGFACAGTVVLAHKLFSRRVAVIAGIVSIVLPRFTYMGSEARSYALSAAIAVWLTVLFVTLVSSKSKSVVLWLAYAVTLAFGVYVFLYLALLVLVHGAYLLTVRRDERLWGHWIRATVVSIVLASPIVAIGIGERHQIAFLAHRSRATFNLIVVEQWFGNAWLAALCWGLIILGSVAAIVSYRRRNSAMASVHERLSDANPRGVIFLLVWCLVPTGLLVAASVAILPLYTNRYLSFCAPAAAILVAVGVAALPRFWLQITALAGVVAFALPTYVSDRTEFGKPGGSDWSVVSTFVHDHAKAGDAIVFDNGVKASWRPRLALHTYPADFTAVEDIALKTPFDKTSGLWDAVYPLEDVTSRLVGVSRVWALETTASHESSYNSALNVLKRNGFMIVQSRLIHRTIIYELVRSRS